MQGNICTKRLLLVETSSHLIVIGIPGGWSLVWNEKFTIVWFFTLAQLSHVLGNFARHTDWIQNWWLVSFWAWLAFHWYVESVAGKSVAFQG